MTNTLGTERPAGVLDAQTRADYNKPQGLKSHSGVSTADYPHLGFNPAPGSTDTVHDLYVKLTNCAKVLEESHGLVTKLMDGSYWKGDAAVAFREELDGGPLPLNLKNAAHSIRKAARQLDRWEGELEEFQRRAKKLESDARDARDTLDAAKGLASTAQNAPDLKKKGSEHDTAQKALTRANTAVTEAQSDLDAIIARARKLAEEHEQKARYRAGKITDATQKLAPSEPGLFDEALDWVTDNLPDILSWTAAVLGIIALFVATGGTAAAVLLLAAAALSVGAVATRLADPAVRASLWDGIRYGEFDADFWSNAIGLAADGLGMLPGLGAAAKGAPVLFRSVGEAGEALTVGQRVAAAGGRTMESAKSFAELRNPFTEWVVTKAPRLSKTVEVTEAVAPWAGLATASYGLAASLNDSLDNDTVSNVGTGVDGVFLGPIDTAETVDLVRRVFGRV
ncbi:DivIVA domain-containing protein [Streptomyces sp. NPDC001797]|uniref:DivIVA domain-containing protein n=1 Tax=Streptomyces sp. NPDC001797 TaxID=3364610 RepID=UPI0036926AFB